MATLNFPLRFQTEKQKADIMKIAKANNRSLNAQVLHLIDGKIVEYLKSKLKK